jgi:Caspase domain
MDMSGRYALIVATDTYEDPKLRRLRTPALDAESLAGVLRDAEIGGFSVELSLNEAEHMLRRRIATFFADRQRDDLLLMHFSCHGVKDDSGQLYFAARDTAVPQLDASAVSAEFLSRQMSRSRSQKIIVLLDCCYSGAIARGLRFRGGDKIDVDENLGGTGRVIITASSAMEYAFEGDDLSGAGQPSVFTSAVVKGLQTGEADRDQDHRISVRELYEYVCDEVHEITPNQRPNLLSHLEGELYVARSSWIAPVAPGELAPELHAALENGLPSIREGAVAELARLLTGRDRPMAEAARVALLDLTKDDSRRVSQAAENALAAANTAAQPSQPPAPAPTNGAPVASTPAPAAAPVATVEPPAEPAAPPPAPVQPAAPAADAGTWPATVLRPWLAAVGAALIVLTALWLPARAGKSDAALIDVLRCGLIGVAIAAAIAVASVARARRRNVVVPAALFGLAAAPAALLTLAYGYESGEYLESPDDWVPVAQFALIGAAAGFGAAFALGRRAAVPVALAGFAAGALGGLVGLTSAGEDLYSTISGNYYSDPDDFDQWRTQLGYVKWLWPQLAASAVIALGVVLARRRVARR